MQNPLIGIIGGKGRMGKLFADFFKDQGLKVLISDKGTKLKNTDLAQKCDITIVSVPIDQTPQTIQEILPQIPKTSALMDFTSVKAASIKIMLKGKCEVFGIHPMFGNSNPIPGQTIILCPTRKSGKWAKWIENIFRKSKVKIIKMSSKEHDKIMGVAQALVHFAEITFADALRRTKTPIKEILKYTGRASELKVQLSARILDQDAGLYGNIQIQNPKALKLFKEFQKSINELVKITRKKDIKSFKKYFQRNRNYFGRYTKEAYEDSSYLIDKFIEKINREMPRRKSQAKPRKTDLAVLGPKNTFTDIAASKYLARPGSRLKNKYFTKDINEVFELVEKGSVAYGLVPIENKLHGTVRETLDGLFYRKVHVTDEISIPINHCLVTLASAKKADIKTIISHPQAINQCEKFLRKNFPKAEREFVASTGIAINRISNLNDKSIAAIAPEIAGEKSHLKIEASKIEDEHDNSTSFVIIEKGNQKRPKEDESSSNLKSITSIAFHFSADSPGSLFTVFKDFADAKINMTKIESRPTKARFGDYIFYLDFEGHISEEKIQMVIKKVEQKVAKLKVLGSYSLA